jgi:WD40 repeat protein
MLKRVVRALVRVFVLGTLLHALSACQFIPQRSIGLLYILEDNAFPSNGEIWRIDNSNRQWLVRVPQTQSKEKVAASPDGNYIAYSVKDTETLKERLYLAHSDGSQSIEVTDWHKVVSFRWLNSEVLTYTIGEYLEQNDLENSDVRRYFLNIRTGEVRPMDYPYKVQDLEYNPRYPDWATYYKRGEDFKIINFRTGAQIGLLSLSEREAAIGSWSPDGHQLAIRARLANAQGDLATEYYLADADGSHMQKLTDLHTQVPDRIPIEFVWSPNGKWLALLLLDPSKSRRHLYLLSVADKKLTDMELEWDNPDWPVWSPDSSRIAFTRFDSVEPQDQILTISIFTKQVKQLTDGPGYKSWLSWR